jgi:CheY-like chemotaxis protein
MNGTINVESAIGEGSTFVVRFHALPGHKEIESKKVPVEEEKGEILEDTEKKVLVVEDDENSIFAINFVLKNISDADFVKNGEEAIEMAKKNKYDLILMDIGLEGISGLEATKEIRKLAGYKKTPIVAVTAFAMVGDKEKFLAGGCSHYLSKPFKISEFKKFVTDILIKK